MGFLGQSCSLFSPSPLSMIHLIALGQYVSTHVFGIVMAIVATFAIGFTWHGPLFGRQWMKANGIKPPKPEDVKFSMMAPGLIANLIMAFCQSAVLGRAFQLVQLDNVGHALVIATIIWLPFTALVLGNIYMWVGRSWTALILDAAHALVATWAIAAILFYTL